MFSKIFLTSFLALIALVSSKIAHADNTPNQNPNPKTQKQFPICQVTMGSLACTRGLVQSIPMGTYGIADLNGTEVSGPVKNIVSGLLTIENSKFDQAVFLVADQIAFENSLAKENMTLTGSLVSLSDVTLQKSIMVNTPKVLLNNTALQGNLLVNLSEGTPQVSLKGSSKISGNIIFTGNPGAVCIDPKVQLGNIIHGYVSGTCDVSESSNGEALR